MHYTDVSHRGLSPYIQEFASKEVVLENEIFPCNTGPNLVIQKNGRGRTTCNISLICS